LLELYHAVFSTCSQKVRLILVEKNLDWQSRELSLPKGEHLSESYLKLNPNGVVPTLIHDGDPITDSSVINEYLDDVFPDRPVRPRDPKALARMRAWRQYFDEVATPAIRVPSFNAFFLPIWQSMSEDEFLAHTERLPLRKHFFRKMGRGGFSDADVNEALEKLGQTLARMEAALEAGPWLMGDQYTIADASITPSIVRLDDIGLPKMWKDLPRVKSWYRRVQDRPNFSVAYMPGSRDLGPSC